MFRKITTTLFALLAPLALFAAVDDFQASLPTVNAVDYEFIGHPNLSEQAIKARILLKSGDKYDQVKVNQSIRSLYNTASFERVEVRTTGKEEGVIDVTFMLHSKNRIEDIFISGNSRIKTKKIFNEMSLKPGDALSDVVIHQEIQTIGELYRKKGYTDVSITHRVEPCQTAGKSVLIFEIDEGAKIKIGKICFKGNACIKAKKLKSVMSNKEWSWFSIITDSGRFLEENFFEDLQQLRQYYRDQGFLDVEIHREDVEFTYPKKDRLNITITVHEGHRYRIGAVRLSGNSLFPKKQLLPLVKVKSGQYYSAEDIDNTVQAIREAYGEVGYLETYVEPERTSNLATGNIDLEFKINESEKFYVESIIVEGNTKTKSTVILRELALAPGDIFDLKRMNNSQKRLENTQFFEAVTLVPESSGIPGRKNLLISTQEGRTGSMNFGISFSSLESITGSIEVSQSNFDWKNYKNMFQGGGQKFRIRLAGGKKSNQFAISFEEPWLYQRELAWGFELFRTQNDYNSDLYSERRIGMETHIRKRLFELVEARLAYRLEEVELANVDKAKAPTPIVEEAGRRSVSKVSLQFARDTRDNLIFPTRGTRAELGLEFAGGYLGGQTDYLRINTRLAYWLQLFELQEQVLLVTARTGTVIPYDGGRVPFFDRYFLGGPTTLRGYDNRDVGPKDPSGEPTGGETVVSFTTEYTIKLIDIVRFAVFYDWGYLNSDSAHWGISDYRHNWGVGLRIFVLGAPLKLDVGFPLREGRNDHEFHFSFGTTF